jgi:hypothetical protein
MIDESIKTQTQHGLKQMHKQKHDQCNLPGMCEIYPSA